MSNMKPIILVTTNERIQQLVRSAVRPNHISIVSASSLGAAVIPMTKSGISLMVVDLACRALSGDDLMAIARVAEGRDVPLLILTRQPRHEVKGLAAVIGARDVISISDTETMVGARIRMWLGLDEELETLPLGFTIVQSQQVAAGA